MAKDAYTDAFRLIGLGALLWAVYLLAVCPCGKLLECKDHTMQFTAALVLAQGSVILDNWRHNK